jgi:hypothetical protein
MKLIYTIIANLEVVIFATALITSTAFTALRGLNAKSLKPSTVLIFARSRIECCIKCSGTFGCGGFNYQSTPSGLVECDLKQGKSDINATQTQNDVTYYQILDECRYL